MKTVKLLMVILLLISVITIAQTQQSAFQGIWIGTIEGEGRFIIDRSAHRLEISGNRWSHFFNNEIQAAGTARFSAGRAELLLANGNIYFDLILLAPGLIMQPVSWTTGEYRFRIRNSTDNSSNQTTIPDNRRIIMAENLYQQANEHLKNGNYDQAIADFTEAIRFNPNYSSAYNGRGLAIWKQGMWSRDNANRAIADFTEAIRLNPNNAEAHFNLGVVKWNWSGREIGIANFSEAIRINPNYVEAYYERALQYHNLGNFNRAIADYEIVLRLSPNYGLARQLLEAALQQQPPYLDGNY